MKLSDGRETRCHQDQLQKRTVEVIVEDPIELETPTPPVTQSSSPVSDELLVEVPSTSDTAEQTAGPSVPNPSTRRVYPKRHRTAVHRYKPTL